ncbi:hypothetical protein IFM89_011573 [Coptis chinensis]|uniref:DNA-directed RNA polymerase n=1 Tax=Coptis chinensis TaxID=261450 RepID=A0A835H4C2_9MAGN|nr:hypothetical protein IFM89_011573 [Coptis chinensis]
MNTWLQVRSPSVGDKFSSMHGQKGVIGLLESQENFPFTHQGIVPDIVINPHAFPTRKIPGQLLEAALGKGIASGGLIRYVTPLVTPSVDDITEQRHSVDEDDVMGTNEVEEDVKMSDSEEEEEDERVEEVTFTEEGLSKLCREASRSFFKEYGLLSHQIHSYNDFVENGVQKVFDDIGEIDVEPGYDPSKKGGDGGWRRAKVKFGKVKLEKPMFWSNDSGKALKFLPRHARLQHMTYSSRMKVEIDFEVFKLENKSSDKFKTGKETYTQKVGISKEKKEVVIGRIPVMAFVAQERISLKRLWVDQPNWNISYRTEIRRLRVDLKIEEVSASECGHLQRTKALNVHFLGCTIPLWVFLFALGMPSDKEIIEMINCNLSDESSVKLLLSTISYADDQHEGFRRGGYSSKKIDELIKGTRFPPKESTKDCLDKYLFPTLTGSKQKALFLGYMVKRLLQSYSGQGKPDNKDDFRNKRLDLTGELLEWELRNHIKHLDASLITLS